MSEEDLPVLGMPGARKRPVLGTPAPFRKYSGWNQIDWERISRAVSFYRSKDYEYVEVPWYVDEKFTRVTYPHMHAFKTKYGDLVGSAEQSFLALSAQGKLCNNRRYVACTPCFRDHQPDDKFHNSHFMKVELYIPGARHRKVLHNLIEDAFEFFSEEAAPELVRTEEGWDIEVSGIEVGSYGIRVVHDHVWVYGTGLAEPRFSQASSLWRSHLRKLLTEKSVKEAHARPEESKA